MAELTKEYKSNATDIPIGGFRPMVGGEPHYIDDDGREWLRAGTFIEQDGTYPENLAWWGVAPDVEEQGGVEEVATFATSYAATTNSTFIIYDRPELTSYIWVAVTGHSYVKFNTLSSNHSPRLNNAQPPAGLNSSRFTYYDGYIYEYTPDVPDVKRYLITDANGEVWQYHDTITLAVSSFTHLYPECVGGRLLAFEGTYSYDAFTGKLVTKHAASLIGAKAGLYIQYVANSGYIKSTIITPVEATLNQPSINVYFSSIGPTVAIYDPNSDKLVVQDSTTKAYYSVEMTKMIGWPVRVNFDDLSHIPSYMRIK